MSAGRSRQGVRAGWPLGNFFVAGDAGFCAPSCASDGGVCAASEDSCLAPHDPPELDFAGSENASAHLCWR